MQDSRDVAPTTLITRATAAHYRSAAIADRVPRHPGPRSRVTIHEGRQYVVLEDDDGVIGVYRVTNAGVLRHMRRPPPELLETTI